VTGGIDPTYLALTPTPGLTGPQGFINPLWLDTSGNLRSENIKLENAGDALTLSASNITRTGSTIFDIQSYDEMKITSTSGVVNILAPANEINITANALMNISASQMDILSTLNYINLTSNDGMTLSTTNGDINLNGPTGAINLTSGLGMELTSGTQLNITSNLAGVGITAETAVGITSVTSTVDITSASLMTITGNDGINITSNNANPMALSCLSANITISTIDLDINTNIYKPTYNFPTESIGSILSGNEKYGVTPVALLAGTYKITFTMVSGCFDTPYVGGMVRMWCILTDTADNEHYYSDLFNVSPIFIPSTSQSTSQLYPNVITYNDTITIANDSDYTLGGGQTNTADNNSDPNYVSASLIRIS
jgi:uncharacterized protein (DUF2345 family)